MIKHYLRVPIIGARWLAYWHKKCLSYDGELTLRRQSSTPLVGSALLMSSISEARARSAFSASSLRSSGRCFQYSSFTSFTRGLFVEYALSSPSMTLARKMGTFSSVICLAIGRKNSLRASLSASSSCSSTMFGSLDLWLPLIVAPLVSLRVRVVALLAIFSL
jgi:hypothetical protein